jgi:N-acetylglucosamine kinase-like BadF-type ATPase
MSDFVLGLDGGASKTCGAIVDRTGRTIAHARFGGSAIMGRPSVQVLECVRGLVAELVRQAGIPGEALGFAGLGMNGIDLASDLPVQLEELSRAIGLPKSRVKLVNDGIVALWGATSADSAGLIQFGSGFTAAVRPKLGSEHPFDHLDVGRIFDPRVEAICLVGRMIDGRHPPSGLKDLFLKHFGIANESDFAESIFGDTISKAQRFSTAALIFQAWIVGDAGALWLVERTIADLSICAAAMLRSAPDKQLFLGGGIINNAPQSFWNELTTRITGTIPKVMIGRPLLAPELGACVMAAHAAGYPSSQFFNNVASHATGVRR